ncbi:amino acid permease 3, partial [Leishmania donovani]
MSKPSESIPAQAEGEVLSDSLIDGNPGNAVDKHPSGEQGNHLHKNGSL